MQGPRTQGIKDSGGQGIKVTRLKFYKVIKLHGTGAQLKNYPDFVYHDTKPG